MLNFSLLTNKSIIFFLVKYEKQSFTNDHPSFQTTFFSIFFSTAIMIAIIIVPLGFLPRKIRIVFSRESQLRQSRAIQLTVHAGCLGVFIIHRSLTWTTGSLTRAQMLMHANAHEGVRTYVRECAMKVDSGRKIACRTGESNLRQRRAGPMLCQLSSIPNLLYAFAIHNPMLW